jgi:plastocyanin
MKRSLAVASVVSAVVGAVLAVPASAGLAETVLVEDDVFDPDVTNQEVTGTVTWDWAAGIGDEHNVRQDDRLFRSGTPTDDSDNAYVLNPSAGTFHYYCEVHGSEAGGMDGTLKMRPVFAVSGKRGGEGVGILWADPGVPGFASGDQFDVQYKVDDGKWKYWRKNTSKPGASFGKNGKPVSIKPGKQYKVRARSERSANPKKRSGWSPPLAFPT